MSSRIKELLKERDAKCLLRARDTENILGPITRFARNHLSHTLRLLMQWPDLGDGDERIQAVKTWYEQLIPRMELALDRWFQKDRSETLRGEYVAAMFRETVAHLLSCDASNNSPKAKLLRERYTGRAVEIADILTSKVDTSLNRHELEDRIIIIILWGQHGAHFPDT